MFAKYRSHWCYSWRFLNINPVHWRLLNIDHSVVDVCQTSTIKGSQCLLTIERLVDVYETLVLLLSTNKEAMFSKHWLFVNVPQRSLFLMSRNHHYSIDIIIVNTCSLLRVCWNMRLRQTAPHTTIVSRARLALGGEFGQIAIWLSCCICMM